PPATLEASLQDPAGQARKLHFALSSLPDAIVLPANTFAKLAWTTSAPEDVSGLQQLRIEGESASTLALVVTDGKFTPGEIQLVAGTGAALTTSSFAPE